MVKRKVTVLPRRKTDRLKEITVLITLVIALLQAIAGDRDAMLRTLGGLVGL